MDGSIGIYPEYDIVLPDLSKKVEIFFVTELTKKEERCGELTVVWGAGRAAQGQSEGG
jgi:hypothetical protein